MEEEEEEEEGELGLYHSFIVRNKELINEIDLSRLWHRIKLFCNLF